MGWDPKKFNNLRRFLVLGLVGTTLAACDPTIGGSGNSGPKVDTSKPVSVALLVPAGAGNGNLDRLARNLVQSAELALADFPAANIQMQVYNTGGDPGQAANAASKAINNGAKIIIGPLFAESANAVGNTARSRGVNVLSFSNNTEIAGGNVFVLGDTFQNKANRIVGYASSKGYKRIVAVAPNNTAGEIASTAVRRAAQRNGIQFGGVAGYDFSPDGIFAASSRIASKVKSSGSTAIVITADSDAGLPLLAQTLPSSGLNPSETKYLGMTRWDIPSTNLGQPGLRGGWFTLPDTASVQKFNSRFNAAYGSASHPIAGLAYDGMSAVAKLLKSGNSGALTKDELTRTGGFFGTSGVFRLNQDGTNQRALAIGEVTGGSFRVISKAPRSFGGFGS